jgi:glycosyltransferase involved in cell wall biosynthesis
MNELPGVSIIVVNFNNETFLAPAIESALGQTHKACEVIVADDCSTDGSRAVIARYRGQIKSVLRETNQGQIATSNGAWPLARYPILIFLDSDDLLYPHAAATIAARWTTSTVKVQWRLAIIDKLGRRDGSITPKYPPGLDTATIHAELLRTGGSPNSPGSGNAYSRSLLESITADGGFVLERPREISMDTILECNAPFYGDVLTIYEPLSCYRIHDNNDSLQTTVDKERFDKMARYFDCKLDYLSGRCRLWGVQFDGVAARNHSIWALECRLAISKMSDISHEPAEAVWRILAPAIRACLSARLPLSNRIVRVAWFVAVAAGPPIVAKRLIALRFVITTRPAWFERLVSTAANITAARTRTEIAERCVR